MKIEIEWLSDISDCDQAGCSGGYSTGAIVKFDGKTKIKLIPQASCFGGESWTEEEIYREIFERLGHTLEPGAY
jgi:hypothetical protein